MTKLLEQAFSRAQSLPDIEQDAIAQLLLDQIEADDERDVPNEALQALSNATRRAMDSGQPVVMVVDGSLVRIEPSGTTVLQVLPPRRKVTERIKRASK